MNYGPIIFLGVFISMACSWLAFVFGPSMQLGNLQPSEVLGGGGTYPVGRPGLARMGAEVYRENGCYYCHSQQVRPDELGGDISRGWGKRRSVALDFVHDKPVMPGNMRLGPDLANIGARQPSLEWHLMHLYNPQSVMAEGQKSVMPPYPYLFVERKIGRSPSSNALQLSGKFAPKAGYEIVPTEKAYALVHYLLSLRADTSLFEAPIPQPAGANEGTNQVAQGTNAVVNTNAPSTDPTPSSAQ